MLVELVTLDKTDTADVHVALHCQRQQYRGKERTKDRLLFHSVLSGLTNPKTFTAAQEEWY
ncbi:MAG: hypothetical protein FJ147_27580 [Deltaproteobacteria bacterium]|nr:hypothetical protein [Deltaproteobacteria bacterium]